jgi:hypothetical protein
MSNVKIAGVALFLGWAVAAATPPSTHVPLGSRLPVPDWNEPDTADQSRANEVLRVFADCIVGKKPAESRALLRTLPNSPQQARAVTALIGKSTACLKYSGQMALSPILFRGAIAESLWRGDAATRPSLPRAQADAADYERFAAILNGGYPRGATDPDWPATLLSRWMAFCAVRADPAAVDRLLATASGSADELRALAGIRPSLAGCLAQGQTIQTNRITTRALLAEALYQMQSAPEPADLARKERR